MIVDHNTKPTISNLKRFEHSLSEGHTTVLVHDPCAAQTPPEPESLYGYGMQA
jgi:hypothetical protein